MLILETIWWLLFFSALGLCIGSFLNVVIYRLPRDCSLRQPLWSACPGCKHRIHWFDNLPVISFVILGGRCRHCAVPISTRYPVIEILMTLIVLMFVDAFLIAGVRSGLSDSPFGLTDRLSHDWPILLAHIVLFACLLPMSAIDLEYYWVDVRFTNFATLTGFVCHAIWTPALSSDWIRPTDTTALASLCALVGLGVVWVWRICRPHVDPDSFEPAVDPEATGSTDSPAPRRPPMSLASRSRAAGWVAGLLLLGMLVVLFLDEATTVAMRHSGRAMVVLVFFFALIVWENSLSRPSDRVIADAIQEERHGARRMVLDELVLLLPALGAAVFGYWLMAGGSPFAEGIHEGFHDGIRLGDSALLRNWRPIYGLATAASGYVIGGALGWAIRIIFTLAFGKEAFGTGDIHLMAAAGCVAGWPVVLLGFFLTCALAMIGWIAALPFKRTRAVAFGPWLSLSFLCIVVFHDSIVKWPVVERAILVWHMGGGGP